MMRKCTKPIKKVWVESLFGIRIVHMRVPRYNKFTYVPGGWWSSSTTSVVRGEISSRLRAMHFPTPPVPLLHEYDVTGDIPKLICTWAPTDCELPKGWEDA